MTESALPRWDLTGIFPSPTSGEYLAAVATVRTGIEQMSRSSTSSASDSTPARIHKPNRAGSFDLEDTSDLADLLDNYLYCWTSTDSNDAAAASAYGELDMITSPMRALRSRLTTWLGTVKPDASNDPLLSDHRYQVQQAAVGAQHVMAPELEDLAGALAGNRRAGLGADPGRVGCGADYKPSAIDGETRTTS